MNHLLPILKQFCQLAKLQEPFVLATLLHKKGSTYRREGARMIIRRDGKISGLISGGCFEADLQLHARQVLESGDPLVIEYDLMNDDDLIWGMGAGCNGAILVLLQPMQSAQDYQPYCDLYQQLASGRSVWCLKRLDTTDDHHLEVSTQVFEDWAQLEVSVPREVLQKLPKESYKPAYQSHQSCHYYIERLQPATHLLIAGAGPDVMHLVQLALPLGWRITIMDHRPAFLDAYKALPVECIKTRPGAAKALLQDSHIDLAMVMSHHLETDEQYLKLLQALPITYIGLLGPAGRRNQMLKQLDLSLADFAGRLFSPVGIDMGAESPEEIALSIICEMKIVLAGTSGQSLREKQRGIHE
ncbi:XdhC family protein [Pleionea sp. CnH1-48]|uniref:XdhC family protein n=1 Tax=Pleionea sp. CnH1-48 TaxID=2954494 RepID=UPI002096A0E3|nr:XdhC family protein [Pleionea sp. CnH1-48]MCO7225816.1 XdhC family protein [Pleionea sp. CnH1-48]